MSKAIWWIIQRIYVLGLLFIVIWISWSAFAYLYDSVFVQRTAPAQYVDHVLTAKTSMLFEATQTASEPPQPLDHYHGLLRTPVNVSPAGCQTSGCHPPLPHQAKRETRAFANMHVTFLDCMTCHAPQAGATIAHQWVDSTTGQASPSPPMLQLVARLESIDPKTVTEEQAAEITALLRRKLAVANEPALQEVLLELSTTEPRSPVHRRAIRHLEALLPNLSRGDYGALLTPQTQISDGQYKKPFDPSRLNAVNQMDPQSEEYKAAISDLHQPIVAKPDACISCHKADATRIDYVKVGYTQGRAESLRANLLADLIERIRSGEPFYLPTILEVGDDR